MKTKSIKIMMTVLILASMLNFAFIAPVAATPSNDLVGLWHFDEGIGSQAMDSSANGNDGTLSGGRFGNGLLFDGSDDYVNIVDNPTLDITGDITLEAWILIKSFSTSEGWHMYIISKDSAGQRSYGIGVDLTWKKTNTPFIIVFDSMYGTYKIAWGTSALVTGTWYHIAGVFNSVTDQLTLYVNGNPGSPVTETGSIYSGSADLRIGARQYAGHRCFFNGIIDEVRISDSVRYLAAFSIPTMPFLPDSNTIGLWHFDESIGNIASDSSGKNNHGIIYGAKWNGPIWTTDSMLGGWALSFDGDNDYVRVAPSSTFGLTDKVTATAWIKPTGLGSASPPYGDVIREEIGYELSLTPTGKVEIALRRGGSWSWYDSISTISIPSTEYHFVAFTFDKDGGANNLKIYIDDMVTPDAQFTVGSTPLDAGGALGIGAAPHAGTYWWYEGLIDEVNIWNAVLPFHLEFALTSASIAEKNKPATLTTILTDDNGNPVEGVEVDFTGAPTGLTFDPTFGITISDGSTSTDAEGTSVGIYTVTATVETPFSTISDDWTLVIYDPSAGFVTGGGWINSPPGAYTVNPIAEGKATFGFVSKYQKGKIAPTGQTQFIFHAGDLNFHSTSYNWLVVAGCKAIYRGSGTVNGEDGYTFMLSAIDGQLPGGNGMDKFRIQIWAPGDGLLYDNQSGSDKEADPTTEISGGSIVIHTAKTK